MGGLATLDNVIMGQELAAGPANGLITSVQRSRSMGTMPRSAALTRAAWSASVWSA